MYLIAFDFWSIGLVFLGLALLGFASRLTRVLANYTERSIVFIAQMGLRQLAKTLLAVLIGYDERVYRRSRFELRNQVAVRFSVLWGAILFTVTMLFVLREALVIESVSRMGFWLATAGLGLRCVIYWTAPKRSSTITGEPALDSLIQDVNERTRRGYPADRQMIRRWDYLDELFAQPI